MKPSELAAFCSARQNRAAVVEDAFGKTRGCRTVTLACKPIENFAYARVDEGAPPLGVETSLA